jgi:putative peptidoglycan lipid II flippase
VSATTGRRIAIAALLIALGNIASRVLGQIRESVTAGLFGASVDASAYALAARVPTTLYDFIVGGLISAALVPVFSELAERDERELGSVAGTVFTLATLVIGAVAAVAWVFAPALGTLMTINARPEQLPALRATTISLIRWMLPATVLMAVAGLTTGLLQARHQFLRPAFATSVFNVGIIAGAVALNGVLGVRSLAAGMIIGGVLQVALQAPGLRGTRLRPNLRLRHPDVRRIGRLYVPVVIGLSFALVGTTVDTILAAGVEPGAPAVMRYATTLVQLALGIIATAVSLAALPTLSRQDTDPAQFRRTLMLGIKVVLLLILPATALMAALAQPIIVLLFQQGEFGAAETAFTARALLLYLPSLVAAAIDQPLIFAFYARKNTLLPNLVNGVAIAMYLVVAVATVRSLGVYGLILANGVQWIAHALLMLWFAHRRLDALRGQGLGTAWVRGTLASLGAGAAAYGVNLTLGGSEGKAWALLVIVVGGSVGCAVYWALATWLRLEALSVLANGIGERLARRRRAS